MGFNDEFRERTKKFSLRVIKLFQALPRTDEARIIGKQLLRCSTSIGANFRAATRARSSKEFYAKLCIVVEEADETIYWLELLSESKIFPESKLNEITQEALEITKIASTTRKNFTFSK